MQIQQFQRKAFQFFYANTLHFTAEAWKNCTLIKFCFLLSLKPLHCALRATLDFPMHARVTTKEKKVASLKIAECIARCCFLRTLVMKWNEDALGASLSFHFILRAQRPADAPHALKLISHSVCAHDCKKIAARTPAAIEFFNFPAAHSECGFMRVKLR